MLTCHLSALEDYHNKTGYYSVVELKLTWTRLIVEMGNLFILFSALLLCAVLEAIDIKNSCSGDVENCVVGLCNVTDCTVCARRVAVCNTKSSKEPVPQTLPIYTDNITLTYVGATPIQLTLDMFERYIHLHYIKVSGNIVSIAPMTFTLMASLEKLTITNTKIDGIPFDAFSDGNKLRFLVAPYNNFTQIPYHLFGRIKRLSHLDLSYNPIQICDESNQTLGEQFNHFSYLDTVILSGLGDGRCRYLPDDFFMPMREIRVLDLSESKLLLGSPKILRPLRHLAELHINKLEPYKTCPSKVAVILAHLPPSLKILHAQGWRSSSKLNQNCMLNESHLESLRQMNISLIDFSESDWILGGLIKHQFFYNMTSLKSLQLSWIRVSSIEAEAFQSLSQLSSLTLNGNQIGPRRLRLFGSGKTSQLKALALNNMGILHDEDQPYDMQHLLQESPLLVELFLNSNFLTRLPSFTSKNSTKPEIYYNMIKLAIDDNELKDLSAIEMAEMCDAMPNLLYFSAQQNSIVDVTGICSTLRKLDLDGNDLGRNEISNFVAMRRLHHLIELSLANNGIQNLIPDLVQDMVNLTSFLAGGNSIQSLPQQFFKNNPRLAFIDMRQNPITILDVEHFSYSTLLHSIYFQASQLTTISDDVREKLDSLPHLIMLDITGNPFDCKCGTEDRLSFQQWIKRSPYVANVKNLTCAGEDPYRIGDMLYNYTQRKFHCVYRIPVFITLAIVLTLILVTPLAMKIYKFRWYLRNLKVVARAISSSLQQVENEQHCKFAAIVSYDKNDESDIHFIMEYLIPNIEDSNRLEVLSESSNSHSGSSDQV